MLANGTALMLFNATVAVPVFNVTLPAEPMWGPVVELDGVPVPALFDGRSISVVTGGEGLVTIRYVPKLVTINEMPAVNITTRDVVLIWANGSLLVIPSLKVLNFTRVDSSLLILAKGPGYVAYAAPRTPGPPQPQTTAATTTAAVMATTGTGRPTEATTSITIPAAATTTSPAQSNPTDSSPVGSPSTKSTAAVTTQPAPAPSPSADQSNSSGEFVPVAVAAVAAAGAALVLLSGRRRQQKDLPEVDVKILEYVKKRGGAYEADIAKDLNIPRTTVFRAVRRLEAQGLLRLEKREGRNWVKPTE